MMDSSKRKGYLFCSLRGVLQAKKWQKRYYVLHAESTENQARIDFYDTEDRYRTSAIHGSMYLDDIETFKRCTIADREHTFEVILKSGEVRVFAALSEEDMTAWLDSLNSAKELTQANDLHSLQSSQDSLDEDYEEQENALYQSVDKSDYFDITVVDSSAAQKNKLSGHYRLAINRLNMAVIDPVTAKVVIFWSYRYIRRYGRSKTTFTFEAGRKCSSGEGYFSFKVPCGNAVFEAVLKRTKEMKSAESKPEESNVKERATSLNECSPELPARKYLGDSDVGSGRKVSESVLHDGSKQSEGKLSDDGLVDITKPERKVSKGVISDRIKLFEETTDKKENAKPAVTKKLDSKADVVMRKEKPVKPARLPKPKLLSSLADANHENYLLAKTVSAPESEYSELFNYDQCDKPKVLDLNYTTNKSSAAAKTVVSDAVYSDTNGNSSTDPIYHIYDYTQSSRFSRATPEEAVYDDPCDPSYEKADCGASSPEYAEPDFPKGDAWKKHGLKNDNIFMDNFDTKLSDPKQNHPYKNAHKVTGNVSMPASKISEINNALRNQQKQAAKSDYCDVQSDSQYDRIEIKKEFKIKVMPDAGYGRLQPLKTKKK